MTLNPLATLPFSTLRSAVGAAAFLALSALTLLVPAHAEEPSADAKASSASTEPTAADAETLFKQLDKNGDGTLAADEVPEEKRRLVRRLLRTSDADSDGKLSREEFVAAMTGPRGEAKNAQPDTNAGNRLPGFMQLDPDTFFQRLDKNNDGKVTPDEIPEERRERFSGLLQYADKNSNGGLDREEFLQLRERFAGAQSGTPNRRPEGQRRPADGPSEDASFHEAVFRALDKNGDGKLSSDEIRGASDSLAPLDKDGDGSITAAELNSERRRPRFAGNGQGNFDPDRAWRRLLSGDKNSDGKLSKDELPERMQQGFDRLDQNGDGFVDEQEMKAGLAKLREAIGRNQ